jgi:hypothetical protein
LQKCEKGEWPTGDVAQSRARPIIGVSAFLPAREMAAEVEAL